MIEAAGARETVVPEYSVSGPCRSWTAADDSRRIHEGMDMGCSRKRKERRDNPAILDRDHFPVRPAPRELDSQQKEGPGAFFLGNYARKTLPPEKKHQMDP